MIMVGKGVLIVTMGLLVCFVTLGCAVDFGDVSKNSHDGSIDAPGEETLCDDGIDNDGDSYTDCEDPGCYDLAPCAAESDCLDGLDNDEDGQTDCDDDDCWGTAACAAIEICENGVDDDGDGFTDCDDWDCSNHAACVNPEGLSCMAVNHCLNCCPSDDDGCFFACFEAASTTGRDKYDAMAMCINNNCTEDCQDLSSEQCKTCQEVNCGAEVDACDWDSVGSYSCVELSNCVVDCPPPAEHQSGDEQSCPTDPGIVCYNECFGKSNQDAVDKLMAYNECVWANCKIECASNPGDQACTDCIMAHCEAEGMACQQD